jgi:hypothetical protein
MWSKQKLDCKIYYRLYDFPIVYGSFLSTNSIASSGSFIQGVCIPNLYTISVEFTFFLCSTAGTPTINKLYFDASKLHQKWKGSQNMRHYITIFSSSEVFFYISNYITLYISWEFLACIKLFILTSLYLKQNIQILLKKMHHEKRKKLQPNDISEWCLCENSILFKYQVTCFHFCFQVK